MSQGLFTQPAADVLTEVDEFYFGGVLPWYHGTRLTGDRRTLYVVLDDPNADEGSGVTKCYRLSAEQIKNAYFEAKKRGYHLCCALDIEDEGIGFGCASDLDVVLQTACYRELVFA